MTADRFTYEWVVTAYTRGTPNAIGAAAFKTLPAALKPVAAAGELDFEVHVRTFTPVDYPVKFHPIEFFPFDLGRGESWPAPDLEKIWEALTTGTPIGKLLANMAKRLYRARTTQAQEEE